MSSRRRPGRVAPERFARSPQEVAPTAHALWRGLRLCFLPTPGTGVTGMGMVEWLGNVRATNNYLAPLGEAHGLAASTSPGNGLGFGSTAVVSRMPTAAPLSAFAFLVRRDSSATIQSLVGNGGTGIAGWTFQLNYGAGEIGLTRWGIADNKSTTLGAVPNTNGQASAVGFTLDGTTARFFLNGAFQDIASGAVNAPSGGQPAVARNGLSVAPLLNTSLYVVYVWDRVLRDGEMLALWRDPWAIVRPRLAPSVGTVAAVTDLRASQLLAEVAVTPSVALRVTQLVAEALVTDSTVADLRASQLVAEVFHAADPALRASQLLAEILATPTVQLQASQLLAEIMVRPDVALHASQLVAEVLVTPNTLSVTPTGLLFPRGSVPPF